MPDVMSGDAETHSAVELGICGADAYSRDVSTRCLMWAWHLNGSSEPGQIWLEGDPVPPQIVWHVNNGGMFSGWNVNFFDRLIWNRILVPKHGWPAISDDAWIDSMHMASAANMPRSLDACGKFMGLQFDASLKDKNRIRRITSAKHTKIPFLVSDILNGRVPIEIDKKKLKAAETPLLSQALYDELLWLYNRCRQDIVIEEDLLRRLPPWPQMEPWRFMPSVDKRINDRGILLDIPLVEGLKTAALKQIRVLNADMERITGGQVTACTKVEDLKQWLVASGVALPDNREPIDEDDPDLDEDDIKEREKANARKSPWKLRKSDMADLLARPDLPEACRLAVAMRAEASKVSTSKFNRMLWNVSPDGRLRNTMTLGGAQQTLRFASRGCNLYNTVRDVFGNPDEIAEIYGLDGKTEHDKIAQLQGPVLYDAIMAGRSGDHNLIGERYARVRKDAQRRDQTLGVMTWISRMTRRTLAAPAGYLLLNGDYAQVEARITVWLAQQLDVLNAFATGQDVYKIVAAGIYKCSIDQLTKTQRQAGKVAVLACIGEGSLVLTDKGLVPIEQVSVDNKVWDGVEWVSHDGPVFRGWRETIQHDGLEATRDHIVYTSGAARQMAFGDAAAGKVPLTQTESGGRAIWAGGDNSSRRNIRDRFAFLCRDTLYKMRLQAVDFFIQPDQRQEQRLSGLYPRTAESTAQTKPRAECSETAMRKSKTTTVCKLWWARYSVSLCVNNRSRIVGAGASWTQPGQDGDRPDRKQRPLRAGQFALGDAETEYAKYAAGPCNNIFRAAYHNRTRAACVKICVAKYKVFRSHVASLFANSGNRRRCDNPCREPAAFVQARRPVWDLLNAGPRHRFTVSGRLVHNCGFGGGTNALLAMAYGYGLMLTVDEAAEIVKGFRAANQALVKYWYATDDAAAKAVQHPGYEFPVGPLNLVSYFMQGDCLCCRLPSGRLLRYWQPRLTQEYWADGRAKDRLSLSGIAIKGKSVFRRSLYHTICFENQVQSIGADMLATGLQNMDQAGIPVVLHVYDNAAAEAPEDRAHAMVPAFDQCMLSQAAWTRGLPIDCATEVGARFA